MSEKKKARPQPLKIGGVSPVAEATDSPDGAGGKFSVDTTEKEYVLLCVLTRSFPLSLVLIDR